MSMETQLLEDEVDRFAHDIKVRLKEKYHEGYTGWDDATMQSTIAKAVIHDAHIVLKDILNGNVNRETSVNCIDVAARAMFLYRFTNSRESKIKGGMNRGDN